MSGTWTESERSGLEEKMKYLIANSVDMEINEALSGDVKKVKQCFKDIGFQTTARKTFFQN